jgi:glucose/arabinose dehydrogenase/plastocyanin
MTDSSLGVEVAATGLTEPTAVAFADATSFFVTEKRTGQVHLVRDGVVGSPVLDLAVNFFDERGLLGIAVHPDFASNGFVYLYWTESGQGDAGDPMLGSDTEDAKTLPPLANRVDRFHWDGTKLSWDRNLVKLRSNTLDTDTSGRVRGNHDAGPRVFGKDGKLFLVIGDQNQRAQLQNLPDGPAPDDTNLTGVVLRLNDDGTTPQDNPFFAAGAAKGGEVGENIQKIWAYGVRNSFGLAIHPGTGALWETENGDDSWDEVNIFPTGSNSGWIQLIGPPERFAEYKQMEIDSPDGLDNKDYPPSRLANSADEAQQRMFVLEGSRYVPPVFSWKYPVAVTAIGFVTDDRLGPASANTAWMGTVLTDSLYRYPLASDGSGFDLAGDAGLKDRVDDNGRKGDVGESAKYVVGTGFGVVTGVVRGPDGMLYVSSLSNGEVYRIGPADTVGRSTPGPTGTSAPAPTSAQPSGSAGQPSGSAPSGAATAVTVGTDTGADLKFDPAEVSARAGAPITITFQNRSTVPHNLTFQDPVKAATSTVVQPGSSEALQLGTLDAGTYPFVCTLHPGMDGKLVVTAG